MVAQKTAAAHDKAAEVLFLCWVLQYSFCNIVYIVFFPPDNFLKKLRMVLVYFLTRLILVFTCFLYSLCVLHYKTLDQCVLLELIWCGWDMSRLLVKLCQTSTAAIFSSCLFQGLRQVRHLFSWTEIRWLMLPVEHFLLHCPKTGTLLLKCSPTRMWTPSAFFIICQVWKWCLILTCSTVFLLLPINAFTKGWTCLPSLTWHVFHGWERGGRGWPCSRRCCFHTASDSEPWQHVSDSCRSIGCALEKTGRTQIITGACCSIKCINAKHIRLFIYHPVLILLWSIMYCSVPGIGATSVDFAHIEHPVSTFKEKTKQYCWEGETDGDEFTSLEI